MTSYTVLRTHCVDDYKRPQTDTDAIITTSDYNEAVIVAANAWLEEFYNNFVYDDDCDSPFIDDIKQLLSASPSAEAIVDFFNHNHDQIWEPEFIHQPWFSIDIQEAESGTTASLNTEVIADLLSVNN
jgi:hypothetical protein